MNAKRLPLAAVLLLGCATAWAGDVGSFTYKGKTFALKGGYAYAHPDPFDKSKPSTVVVLGARPVDAKKIDAADDRIGALRAAFDQFNADEDRPPKVEIVVSRELPPAAMMISFTTPDTSLSASGKKVKLELARNDGKRIEGTLRSLDQAAKTSEFGGYFDLHFALDVSSDPDL
jgi:hypothetical protein